ncbi:ABC transporter substrate-binding protein [Treponema vincentii]|uniref:ABC transporter substrate-binding protein n=1 Tax=Treponema vincentii TaxID=69710 RepID=UPI002EDA44A7
MLESWVPQEKVTVVPNEKYWNKENVHLSRITFLPIEDSNTAFEKIQGRRNRLVLRRACSPHG